jgi:diaminopimelate decarboxylase
MKNDAYNLFPISTAVSAEDHLAVAGHDLTALAEEYGTPLYIYDGATVRSQVSRLQDLLRQSYPAESALAYAAKACFSLLLAKKLAALGLSADVASLGELRIAGKAGFPRDRTHLHGNNKSDEELNLALNWDIEAIVVDSLDELEFLDILSSRAGKRAKIWLRITPDLQVETHPHIQTAHTESKFGLHVQSGEAVEAVRRAQASPRLQLTGLHVHLGSMLFDPKPYQEAIEALFEVARAADFIPAVISPGGGWGVRYTEEDPDDDPLPWVRAGSGTVQQACSRLGWPMPKLVLEPGRWLIARAGVAVYRVGAQKATPSGMRMIAVDGGLADNPRVALYQARYTARLANRVSAPDAGVAKIVGKFCESGDVLIPKIRLPEVRRGDLLAVPVSGAYQLSMASNYNLAPRPAALWLENGTIEQLQPREQPDQSAWWLPPSDVDC